jgi:heme exporter protein D
MKKLVLIIFLLILIRPAFGLSYEEELNNKIIDVESTASHYQDLILNLNSQGAYTSRSIKILSEMRDLIWQAKMLITGSNFYLADQKIEEAKSIAPKITMDIRFSLKINKGRLALEEAFSLISKARKEGYDVKAIEDYYYDASSLFNEAKENYANEEYDYVDSKIDSILETNEKISSEIEKLNDVSIQPASKTSLTGFIIADYSWLSYVIGLIALAIVALIAFKRSRRKKELKGIPKLVRIKCRLE